MCFLAVPIRVRRIAGALERIVVSVGRPGGPRLVDHIDIAGLRSGHRTVKVK